MPDPAMMATLAWEAMITEVDLSPKPGLVDRLNTGAHKDMDRHLFHKSARAIRPFFAEMVHATPVDGSSSRVLPLLRPIGILAERAMGKATEGINTHRGQIFSLGVCLAASKRVHHLKPDLPGPGSEILLEAGRICRGITEELRNRKLPETASHGERVYQTLHSTGIRGEAEAAFPSVRLIALPLMEKLISQGFHPEQATLEVLLHLYLHCEDSTVLHRRGEEGLSLLRRSASRFLSDRGIRQPEYLQRLDEMNTLFVSENISPGGCADLLALTLFIHRMGEKF